MTPPRTLLCVIGDPDTVRGKVLTAHEALGGLSRITFQMSNATLETEAMQRSIELLGIRVAPGVRAELEGRQDG